MPNRARLVHFKKVALLMLVSYLSSEYFYNMDVTGPSLSMQEKDLALFLEALGMRLPAPSIGRADGYVVVALGEVAGRAFKSNDKTVLLGYRYKGKIYPLSIHFLREDRETRFGHSTLLLGSYGDGPAINPVLRSALERFFARDGKSILRDLEPSWENVSLKDHVDCRIDWRMKPTLKVAVDLCREVLHEVPEIPLFPGVYPYNNPYVENLLEVGLPELGNARSVLVLGSGSGLDAVCIAMKYKIPVHATDINPIAIANTKAAARRCSVEGHVCSYASDAFTDICEKFDSIFFQAPLATGDKNLTDANRYDFDGALLRRVFAGLRDHLSPHGRMYLMSRPDLSSYVNLSGVSVKTRRRFEPLSSVAIHEIGFASL